MLALKNHFITKTINSIFFIQKKEDFIFLHTTKRCSQGVWNSSKILRSLMGGNDTLPLSNQIAPSVAEYLSFTFPEKQL
jgi:hypothetical protein